MQLSNKTTTSGHAMIEKTTTPVDFSNIIHADSSILNSLIRPPKVIR